MHDIIRELAVDLCKKDRFGVIYEEDKCGGSLQRDGRRLVVHKLKKDIQQPFSVYTYFELSLHWRKACPHSSEGFWRPRYRQAAIPTVCLGLGICNVSVCGRLVPGLLPEIRSGIRLSDA